jgi:hypothetical protein
MRAAALCMCTCTVVCARTHSALRSRYADAFPREVPVVAGDVTVPASLPACLAGGRNVVFTASAATYFGADAVDHLGVRATAEAARAAGAAHMVLVSSMLVTRRNRWHPIRLLLNNAIKWGIMDAKLAGEATLRASGLPYTIVRGQGGGSMEPGGCFPWLARGLEPSWSLEALNASMCMCFPCRVLPPPPL